MISDSEAVQIVTYLNRAGLLPAMEGQAPVWQDALGNINATDALEACRNIARMPTGAGRGGLFVTPGELIGEIKRIRAKRTAGVELPPPPSALAENPIAQQRWHRAFMHQVGNGFPPEAAEVFACERLGVPREIRAGQGRPDRVLLALAGLKGVDDAGA